MATRGDLRGDCSGVSSSSTVSVRAISRKRATEPSLERTSTTTCVTDLEKSSSSDF